MEKLWKRILSFVLVISLIITSSVNAFALADEEYLCELRIVYADTYNEAKEILSDTEFEDYKLLNENLNEGTEETGVWLAYKTTTDIEDAITDISVMQMNGGYNEGNYEKMIKESYEEYVAFGKTYLKAIEYFIEAYDADHFLAVSAYRQLNFYNVVSENIPEKEIPSFEGECLGDIFYNGISERELATMFMQGNRYAIKNIRSLLAMGVSYNEDGKTYLNKVEEAASKMNTDPSFFDDEDYEKLAILIAPTIKVFRDMFEELLTYEPQLNYADEEDTDLEIKYMEYKAIAEMLRGVNYLDGKSLYQFCMEYEENKEYSDIYPLVAALNEGQQALTELAQYYDVVRYSMTDYPEEIITEELDNMEATYSENPFNVYSGVDRSIYNGTFAFTNEAYRADAYTESDYFEEFFGIGQILFTTMNVSASIIGAGLIRWAVLRQAKEYAAYNATVVKTRVAELVARIRSANLVDIVGKQSLASGDAVIHATVGKHAFTFNTYEGFLDGIIANSNITVKSITGSEIPRFADKYYAVTDALREKTITLGKVEMRGMRKMIKKVNDTAYYTQSGQETAERVTAEAARQISSGTIAIYIVGGALIFYSALSIGLTVYNYYNPDYEDIPTAMVDIINTDDGDNYIKYDVVYEAIPRKKGVYAAGDLNAFEGQRWNALYYTKSYEAGKPLLADEFVASASNNKAKVGYTPVHRFGEEICYDLNKYNFSDESPSIYLSVKQSKNDKSAVADVPEVVGSVFSGGLWMLFGGVGALFGVGGTLGTQALLKKKKTKNSEQKA